MEEKYIKDRVQKEMRQYQDTMDLLLQQQIDFKPAFDKVFSEGQMNMHLTTPKQAALIRLDRALG